MLEIYQPAEDSYLLSKFVGTEISKIKPSKILDMGSGSGIQVETAINHGISQEQITIVDINKDAINLLRKKFPKSKIILSDLFNKISEEFDMIIFNPPYLPKDKFDNGIDTSGGKQGNEAINRFLKQAKGHLSEKGEILLLTSSFTKKIDFSGYNKKILGKNRIFFEELYIWRLSLKD